MKKVQVLFLAASPKQMTALELGEEARAIENRIREAGARNMEVSTKWAVRPLDLMLLLEECRPDLVHFSGHGTKSEEIVLVGDDGKPRPLPKPAIDRLFRTFKDNIRLVLLNACYSEVQAPAIVEHIDCAIGMSREISDRAAILFAASFYQALGFGHSVKIAFEKARLALLIEGTSEDLTPKLLCRKGLDPSELYIAPHYRIAVVDNEPAVAGFLKLALRDWGHEVHSFTVVGGPRELQEEIKQIKPHAVILDYKLGGVRIGAPFVDSLRRFDPDLPILYYTSRARNRRIVGELQAAGISARDIFPKVDAATDIEKLLRRIEEYNVNYRPRKA